MTHTLNIFFALLLFASLSCQSPNENEILPSSPDMSQPIATGLYITGAEGPDPIAVWGNPSDGSGTAGAAYPTFSVNSGTTIDSSRRLELVSNVSPPGISSNLKIDHPYPNPFEGTCAINISLPSLSDVALYAVPARWIGDKSNDINSSAGAVTAAPQRTAIAILMRRQLAAGMYKVLWQGCDQNGNFLPAGFYRIFLRVGDTVSWHDVFLYNETTRLPMSIH